MIRLREQTILMLEHSGETAPFDPTELQRDIAGCFLAAELREESFLAEDITLAVEFALREAAESVPGRAFVKSELDSMVVKVLGNTGFPEVAKLYSERCGDLKIECFCDADALETLLERFLVCSAPQRRALAEKVAFALAALKIASAPHTLILELARYYERGGETLFPLAPVASVAPGAPGKRYYLTASEFNDLLAGDERCGAFAAAGVLRGKGVCRVFPCVRLAVDLARFAELEKLPEPVTELEFQAVQGKLVSALDAAAQLGVAHVCAAGAQESPVLALHLTRAREFSENAVGAVWPQGRRAAREFLQLLADAMTACVDKLALE